MSSCFAVLSFLSILRCMGMHRAKTSMYKSIAAVMMIARSLEVPVNTMARSIIRFRALLTSYTISHRRSSSCGMSNRS